MGKRSPVLGYNHNFKHRGLVFHVQTEDSGLDNPHLFTHLFHGGVIIATRRVDYDPSADVGIVKELMKAQHKAMAKELKGGVHDEKIESYFGNNPDLVPSKKTAVKDAAVKDAAVKDAATEAKQTFDTQDTTETPILDILPELKTRVDDAMDSLEQKSVGRDTQVRQAHEQAEAARLAAAQAEIAAAQAEAAAHAHASAIAAAQKAAAEAAAAAAVVSLSMEETESSGVPNAFRPAEYSVRTRSRVPTPIAGVPALSVESSLGDPAVSFARNKPSPKGTPPLPRAAGKAANAKPGRRSSVVVSRPATVIGSPAATERFSRSTARRPRAQSSAFGKDLVSEKSLDEVIMAYLSEDALDD